jgi:hypothetical protein
MPLSRAAASTLIIPTSAPHSEHHSTRTLPWLLKTKVRSVLTVTLLTRFGLSMIQSAISVTAAKSEEACSLVIAHYPAFVPLRGALE